MADNEPIGADPVQTPNYGEIVNPDGSITYLGYPPSGAVSASLPDASMPVVISDEPDDPAPPQDPHFPGWDDV